MAARAAARAPVTLPGGARAVLTTRADGDARPEGWRAGPGARFARPVLFRPDETWTFVRQVHGRAVVVTDAPTGPLVVEADALVSAAHAGWRGLVAGVLEETVAQMRALGAGAIEAVLAACIHPECYAFSPEDLDELAGTLGAQVRGQTAQGAPALDLPAGVSAALGAQGVPVSARLGGCTACSPQWFSHRARADTGRHALAIGAPPTGAGR